MGASDGRGMDRAKRSAGQSIPCARGARRAIVSTRLDLALPSHSIRKASREGRNGSHVGMRRLASQYGRQMAIQLAS
jgi:hypothetical protein